MAYANTFKRSEKKFLLNEVQQNYLITKIKEYMLLDKYGEHSICNIYCDSDDYQLIRHSIRKPPYKQKLRLRSYGVPSEDSIVFLEIKKKFKGVVYKRRIPMAYKEAFKYINITAHPDCCQVVKEMDYLIENYHLRPKIIISYDRTAYYCEDNEEFRVTFDRNIRSRTDKLDLRYGAFGEKLCADFGCIMEVKCVGGYPLWFTKLLTDEHIYPASFSKYGEIYKSSLEQSNTNNRRDSSCSQILFDQLMAQEM